MAPRRTFPADLVRRASRATLTQAARMIELFARSAHRDEAVGRDLVPAEEPIRFVASERLHLVASDLAGAEPGEGQVRLIANVMGLAGATPALPPAYSELQLQRRRARDASFSHFLNVFDHRALSFFYRIVAKYRWPLLAERTAAGHGQGSASGDPVRDLLVALSGLAVPGAQARLGIADSLLVPQAANLADLRRSARSIEVALRALTGLPLRIVEAQPVWMAVPAAEQARLGACHASLGDPPAGAPISLGGAIMLGSAVIDIQHHYLIEIGPLSYPELRAFCADPGRSEVLARLASLLAGIERRPSLRLLVAAEAIPPLQLGGDGSAAMLGRTTWMGQPETADGLARDCTIALSLAALV